MQTTSVEDVTSQIQ